MKRGLGLDVLSCPRCSGRMMIIASIEEPEVIVKILKSMGLPEAAPLRSSGASPAPSCFRLHPRFVRLILSAAELERVNAKYGAIEGGKQHIGNLGKYLETITGKSRTEP